MTVNMIDARMSDLLWDDDFTRFTAADAIEILAFLADSMGKLKSYTQNSRKHSKTKF